MEVHERESAVLQIAELKRKEGELAKIRRELTSQLAQYYLNLKPSAREQFTRCTMTMRRSRTHQVRKGRDPYELKGSVPADVLSEVFKTAYKVDAKAFNTFLHTTPELMEVVEVKDGAPQITVEVDE